MLNRRLLAWMVASIGMVNACMVAAGPHLVKDGQPRAEIVIAEQAPPIVGIAAEDLQHYIQKISGATLPIVTAPSDAQTNRIYVGKSAYTDALSLDAEAFSGGGFHMASGENWLALVGRDHPFASDNALLPLALGSENSPERQQLLDHWEKNKPSDWWMPFGQMRKQYNANLNISELDERGSYNAVCAYLRSLGVRWYEPGEDGEVVPQLADIALPKVGEVVVPAFQYRYAYCFGGRFNAASMDYIKWQMRMGVNQAPDLIGVGDLGHGIIYVTGDKKQKAAHPEYYALFNGERATKPYGGIACLSSQGLFQENVQFVRTMFDMFDVAAVSVMPGDGYGNLCQCDLCEGKGDPARGWYGHMSNYVWTYVNNVAKEVYKTHPDKKIHCNAYTSYLLPPTNIDQLSPNLMVAICQLRRSETRRGVVAEARKGWLEKLPEGQKQIAIYDYYLEAWREQYKSLPAYYPHAIAADLRSLQGISRGEFIEVLPKGPMYLNLHVTSRLWWDPQQDIDAMLDEYCTLYFGPAAKQMRQFIDFGEANWEDVAANAEMIDKVFEMLAAAKAKVETDSVYARRIAAVEAYTAPLALRKEQLARRRENVPKIRFVRQKPEHFTFDGKIDDPLWAGHLGPGKVMLPYQSRATLKELVTGEEAASATTFQVAAIESNIVFGIKCMDPDMQNLNIGSTVDEHVNIWLGDCIEFLLETPQHSYYQIVIGPTGAIVDVDRKGGIDLSWSSGVEVKTHVADDYWSVELCVPLRDAMQAMVDTKDGIAAKKPTSTYPWYFNLCRQRVRGDEKQFSAYSPTGKENFHILEKFAIIHFKGL